MGRFGDRRVWMGVGFAVMFAVVALRAEEPAPLLEQAEALLASGELAAARALFTRILEEDGPRIPALRGLARVAWRDGDLPRSVREYSKALSLAPDDPLLHDEIGRVYSDMREHARATKHPTKTTQPNPKNAAYWRDYGRVLWRGERYPQAISAFQRAIALRPDDAEAYRGLGDTYLRMAELDNAIAAYDEAIARNAEDVAAYTGKGAALSKKGDFEAAIESLKEAITLDEDYGPAYYELGLALQHQKQHERAIVAFGYAAKLIPGDPSPFANMAKSYARIGKRELAKKAHTYAKKLQALQDDRLKAEAYLAKFPDRPEGYALYGSVYERAGDTKWAIRMYERALEHDPEYLPAHRALATLYIQARRFDAAVRAHHRVLDADPMDIETRVMLGLLLMERGDHQRAREELTRAHRDARAATDAAPTAENWNLLAFALYALGRYEEAESAMLEGIRLDPEEPSYRERLETIRRARAKQKK